MTSPTVLTVTRRLADLCGAQSMLYAAGFGMMTATNLITARSVLNSIDISGVIVCKHSWSDQERDAIQSEVSQLCGDMPIMRCPGCTGCEEENGVRGKLLHISPLVALITQIEAKRS
jgi:hypothetical protein